MAVDRVDVVAQPRAGVGDPQPGGRGELGEALGERPGRRRLDRLGQPEEARRLGLQPRVDPARDEPVVVVAGEHQQLAVRAERAPRLGEERPGQLRGVAVRRLAQLEPVAEDDEPVGVAQRVDQRRAQLGAAREVLPGAAPRCRSEMTSVRTPLVCRGDGAPRRHPRRRLLARPRGAAGGDAARRPRRRRGQGRAARRRRRHARLGPAVARRRRHVLPRPEPQQALARARPRRRGRPSSWRAGWPGAPTC